jgi:hypothetical protein
MIVMLHLVDLFTSQLIVLYFVIFAGAWVDYPCEQRRKIIQLQAWEMDHSMVRTITKGYKDIISSLTRHMGHKGKN